MHFSFYSPGLPRVQIECLISAIEPNPNPRSNVNKSFSAHRLIGHPIQFLTQISCQNSNPNQPLNFSRAKEVYECKMLAFVSLCQI